MPSVSEAETLLERACPDPHTSCICETKEYAPEVDLQIVVPVYNVEKYVEKCIDSILAQQTTYSYKVVVVNDGSPDNSRRILRKYEGDKRVQIIDQENRGFSGARNAGMKRLIGEYLMFVDSDDYLPANAIQPLMDEARRTNADIVQGGYYRDKGGKIKPGRVPSQTGLCEADSIYGFPWGKVYKSTLWQTIEFPEGYWFEDTITAVILEKQCRRAAVVSHPVYCYLYNPKGITATAKVDPKSIDAFYVTRALFDDANKLGLMHDNNVRERLQRTYLKQTRIACIRCMSLNMDIRMALFVVTRNDYLKRFGQDINVSDASDRELISAMVNYDFYAYSRKCTLHQ